MPDTLQFGWHLHSFPVDGSEPGAFRSQLYQTLDAIHADFDSVWVDDHMMPWAVWQSNETPYVECLSTIAHFAALYPKLTFGTSVLCQSYRNPALLAKTVANMQWLTEGRFIFGIGAGWMEPEYRSHNWNFPKASTRIAQMEETIEIARRMWTASPASFEGKYYRIENAYCSPKPEPVPPVLIGGGGEKLTLRVVAKHADMWNINGHTVPEYAHKLAVLRQHCQAVGRNYDDIEKTWSCESLSLAHSEDEARRIAAASPYNIEPVVGTPEQVAAYFQQYVDLGVTTFITRLNDFPNLNGIRLFMEEVIPRLRK